MSDEAQALLGGADRRRGQAARVDAEVILPISWSDLLSLDNQALRFRPLAEHVGPYRLREIRGRLILRLTAGSGRGSDSMLGDAAEPVSQPVLFLFQIVLALKAHPEFCRVAEKAGEQQRSRAGTG